MSRQSLDVLEGALGYRFRSRRLLELALTHSSFAHEEGFEPVEDNERLEFLGDSVLGFLVSDLLYRALPDLKEGELSKRTASLVSAANLVQYGKRLAIGEYLRLGKGEEKTGGRRKQALLVDAFEALLAAVYLDGGFDSARRVVENLIGSEIAAIGSGDPRPANSKSTLQERLQASGTAPARYRLVQETGPDHRRSFTVEVWIAGEPVARGEGPNKKAAEQAAAKLALEAMPGHGDRPA